MNTPKNIIWFIKAGLVVVVGIFAARMMNRSVLALSLIVTILYFATLYLGYRYGSGPGSIVGMACGILETMQTGNLAALGMFCLIGALAGIFRTLSRLASALAFAAGALGVGIIYAPELIQSHSLELIAAVTVFLVLPPSLIIQEVERSSPAEERYAMPLENPWVDRLCAMADSLGQVARTFEACKEEHIPLSRNAAVHVFEEAARDICEGCRECGMGRICEQENQYYIYYFLHIFEQNGLIEEERMPRLFLDTCPKREFYMERLNEGLGRLKSQDSWEGRFLESRRAVASQFKEIGDILQEFTEELVSTTDITEQLEGPLSAALKNRHIQAENMLILEHGNRTQEAVLAVCTDNGCRIATREVADVVGKSMRRRFRPAKESRTVIGPELCQVKLVEDTRFMMLHGVARAVKSGESISGDQFAFQKIPGGRMLLCLSDGMGSGPTAALESETAIELAEQLLGAGFSPERSVQLINSVLLMKSREQTPTTLDVIVVNLYTGNCCMVKLGAAATFRKRGNRVETIGAENLPVGIVTEIEVTNRETGLQDGDWLIMVTDGVLDALPGLDKEAAMEEVILRSASRNPKDFAERILREAAGENDTIRDDMTVLAAGIWAK